MMRSIAALTLLLVVEDARGAAVCSGPLSAAEAVRCALDASLDVRSARQELRALAGRHSAAGVLLPSNPVVSVNLAARVSKVEPVAGQGTFFNWYVTLAQEIEIAGQRGARLDIADAEAAAAVRRVAVAEQEIAATAHLAWLDLTAARELVARAVEVEHVAVALDLLAEARAAEALTSAVDADLAGVEATRVRLTRIEAERRRAEATVALATLLGRPSDPVEIRGALAAPAGDLKDGASLAELVRHALRLRGEIGAADMERLVASRRVTLLRRSRVPSPTLSLFAERDGLDELVLGGGLSIPIPLPAPLGRTLAGEIAESQARVEQAETTVEQVRRRVTSEVGSAYENDQSRAAALALFSPERVARVRRDLAVLGDAITGRQLSLRDALLTQRSFIEMLHVEVEARLARARARVELLRVTGMLGGGL